MLINGEKTSGNIEQILKQLDGLPSSFPHFRSAAFSERSKETNNIRPFLDWNVTQGDENSYKELAESHQKQGTIEQYKSDLEKQLTQNQDSDRIEELANRLALAGVYRVQENHDKAIEQYSAAYFLQQGKVDYEAHRVEQHEVGFSKHEKLGTDNVQDCVTVILHDPVSKMTALAHLDASTDKTSITKDMLNRFPSDVQLNAYLVGGRQRDVDWVKERSDKNIKEVAEELSKHSNINIKSADVGDARPPSAIVFDPVTAKLEHAVPGKINENDVVLRQAIVASAMFSDRLFPALDLTTPKENRPILDMTEEKQRHIVQSYLNIPTNANDRTETWQNNIIVNPLIKAVEKINHDNPQLVAKLFTDHIKKNVNQLNTNYIKQEQTKTNLINATKAQLHNANKETLFNIKDNIAPDNIWKSLKEEKIGIKEVFSFLKNQFIKYYDMVNGFISSKTNNKEQSVGLKASETQQPTILNTAKEVTKSLGSDVNTENMLQKQNDNETQQALLAIKKNLKNVTQGVNGDNNKSNIAPPSTPSIKDTNKIKSKGYGK